jgi:hypothetical protein
MYDFYRQEKTNQCGPSAICSLVNLVQNKKLPVSTVGEWHIDGEGVVNVAKSNIRDFEAQGSWYNGTIAALAKVKIYAHATKGFANAARWVTQGGKYKPAILSIGWYVQGNNGSWTRNGGHWVCAVKVHNAAIICLDPGLDTGVVEMSTADPSRYDVNYGGGVQTGWLDGIILP